MRAYLFLVFVAAVVLCGAAVAGGNAGPNDFREIRIKLDPNSGCWSYLGDATVFTGKFKAGAYLGVQMVTIGQDGFPEPFDQEERSISLGGIVKEGGNPLPEISGPSGQAWFGPLPATKDYSFMFSPRASFGTKALVTICGSKTAPGSSK